MPLLPVTALVRRWRQPASRVEDVRAVARGLRSASEDAATAEERALAQELRALRPRVLEAFDGATACGGCAKGRSRPHGRWDGGFCCGGRTEGVFSPDELAALALGGTRPSDLTWADGDHAGCAFRGPSGCVLRAEDRPDVCVRYACRELEAELRASGRWPEIRKLTRRLEETFAAFVRARSRRPL